MSKETTYRVMARNAQGKAPGSVSTWLRKTERRLRDGGDAEVPCGDCHACCACGYEVGLAPEDDQALETVPAMSDGRPVLPRRADGACVHLVEGRCSIYERRPAACRRYDCRIHLFCGLHPNRPALVEAARRWDEPSAYKTTDDRLAASALRLAALVARERGVTAEVACGLALGGYRDFTPLARQIAAELRARPEVATAMEQWMQAAYEAQEGAR